MAEYVNIDDLAKRLRTQENQAEALNIKARKHQDRIVQLERSGKFSKVWAMVIEKVILVAGMGALFFWAERIFNG